MTDGIVARQLPYLECAVQLGIASGKLVSVSFPAEADPDASTEHELLDRIEAYTEGVEDGFTDVEIGLTLGGDERAILETTREIPYGEEVTVEALVRMTPGLEGEEAAQRVRSVLAENPLPLVIPDHRVRDGPSAAPPAVESKLRHVEGL